MSGDKNEVPQGVWKALFEFAQNLGAQDVVNQTPSSYHQMSEENKKWLEEALSSYIKDSDPIRLMKKHLELLLSLDLQSPNQDEIDQGVDALEHLNDLCSNLDNASDFHKIGGFRILIPLLSSTSPTFRSNGAELIGGLTQNHIYCQQKLHEAKILKVLLELLDSDPDARVKVKSLYAISCLIRSNDILEEEFINSDGLVYLLKSLSSDDERLQVKTCFLLAHLLPKNDRFKKIACDMGMVDQLVSLLGRLNDQGRERAMAALLTLVEDFPPAIEECKRADLSLKDILNQRIDEISKDPSNEEELESCKRLQKICFGL